MILSTILLALGFAWLMVETDWLRIRLPYGSIPEENHDHIKRHPRIELGRIINVAYPETKLLTEMCYVTKLEHELTRKYFRSFATGRDSYQTMSIGGNLLTVNSHNPKLYDVIAEARKIADDKIRKEPYAKLRQTKMFWTADKIYNPDTGNDEPHYKSNCLFPIEWLEAHYNDHKDFEPTIELTVNEKSISFNGDFRNGKIHDFMVLNAELWERPRIKGKKIKVEVN
jgi:hypothetical protein